ARMTSSWPGLNESKPKISFRTLRGTKVNIRPDLYFHKEEIPVPPDQSYLQQVSNCRKSPFRL
ncbi:MAG TPA: hypothetical protein VFH16_11120, partial [Rubrobacter sp.]|nr:hypothetical protein [Rubrobacter sp.]